MALKYLDRCWKRCGTQIKKIAGTGLLQFVSKLLSAGVLSKRAPPLPIPNRVVQALRADDTYAFGRGESRLCQQSKV